MVMLLSYGLLAVGEMGLAGYTALLLGAFTGAAVALLCNIICQLPGESGLLPLGAITPLIGAPVIIYVVLRSKGV